MKIHRNLLWLRGTPTLLDELLADRTLSRLVKARPAPELCAFLRSDHQQLIRRLEKLGHVPREHGRW